MRFVVLGQCENSCTTIVDVALLRACFRFRVHLELWRAVDGTGAFPLPSHIRFFFVVPSKKPCAADFVVMSSAVVSRVVFFLCIQRLCGLPSRGSEKRRLRAGIYS